MNRNLCGIYLRVERNNKFESVCFSDLSVTEMRHILADKEEDWIASLCINLGCTIAKIGEELDIVVER